jgi:hypothetical protein
VRSPASLHLAPLTISLAAACRAQIESRLTLDDPSLFRGANPPSWGYNPHLRFPLNRNQVMDIPTQLGGDRLRGALRRLPLRTSVTDRGASPRFLSKFPRVSCSFLSAAFTSSLMWF